MRKFKRTSELLWLFGIFFVALGVAICSKADLGVSMIAAPTFIVYEAIAHLWSGFSLGVTEYLLQGVILILLCLVIRRFRFRYLFAFAVAVIYGYVLNFFVWVLSGVPFTAVWLRWIMLIVGNCITGFGVACFFRTYMPLQVHELFVAELVDRFNLKLNKTKAIFDISLLVVSILLALVLFGDATTFDWITIGRTSFHSLGLGTLVTTAMNSPIIALMGKLIDRYFDPTPRFPKMEAWLRKNEA